MEQSIHDTRGIEIDPDLETMLKQALIQSRLEQVLLENAELKEELTDYKNIVTQLRHENRILINRERVGSLMELFSGVSYSSEPGVEEALIDEREKVAELERELMEVRKDACQKAMSDAQKDLHDPAFSLTGQ